ncbi:hypothetical protein KXD40_007636 [Peronospora effusa]|uniref:Uncharacterized protein n=1 Tax=Peronospora effusa TaxID=542832 RepID=A0A3M6VTB0_9STRA|nr:hypothetical protein DD238_003366 [Peronospora effusa]RQM18658.1 hypothetical protein DD237_001545 [Peronospora effusa]UIZ23476.1 hypothetical protein KXD40_007636 [Peronospora effusa]
MHSNFRSWKASRRVRLPLKLVVSKGKIKVLASRLYMVGYGVQLASKVRIQIGRRILYTWQYTITAKTVDNIGFHVAAVHGTSPIVSRIQGDFYCMYKYAYKYYMPHFLVPINLSTFIKSVSEGRRVG